jgi:hypothetical protein
VLCVVCAFPPTEHTRRPAGRIAGYYFLYGARTRKRVRIRCQSIGVCTLCTVQVHYGNVCTCTLKGQKTIPASPNLSPLPPLCVVFRFDTSTASCGIQFLLGLSYRPKETIISSGRSIPPARSLAPLTRTDELGQPARNQ